MREDKIKKKTLDALGWYHNNAPNIPGVRDPVRTFYKSYKACGQACDRLGQKRFRACKKPVCYVCSKRWAGAQSKRYVAGFNRSELEHDHFRMITLGIGMYETVEECFAAFAVFRDKFRNTLAGKRSRKKASSRADLWKQFSLVGSLEIDLFRVDQFDHLGSDKRKSYKEEYGFSKSTWKSANVWVVTFHGVVFLGDLSEDEAKGLFKSYCKRVHFEPMLKQKNIEGEIENIMGYSVKTRYRTCLQNGRRSDWRQENVKDYIIAASRLRGRQPFKLFVGRKR